MSATPQPFIVPSRGGFPIPVAFRDGNGRPVDLSAAGLVPVVEFYQPNFGLTTLPPVVVTDAPSGAAVALLPAAVVATLLSPAPNNILIGASAPASVCRVYAYLVDSRGMKSSDVVALYQPLDWRSADPASIPALSALLVVVGPAGAPGAQGNPGAAGPSGSSDPQSATAAGAIAQHQAIYLGPAGALVASSDQPAEAGLVLGISLAAAALGQTVQYTATGVLTDGAWNWAPGPIYLGTGGALTQTPPTSGFAQQVATALTPTTLRAVLSRPVLIAVPASYSGATYLDFAGGFHTLRAAAAPGAANALIATGPDGYLPPALLAPGAVKSSRLAGGPQLASIPNGCFEDGFDGWSVSPQGTAQISIDLDVSAVGRRSAYLRCPTAGDVATIASAPIPCGEGVPVYVGARVLLRGGAAQAVLSAVFYDRNGALLGQPIQACDPLRLSTAFGEFGGFVIPPAGARLAAAQISNTALAGAVGAINVDEVMIQRQACGPAAWQVIGAARTFLPALGGDADAFLSSAGAVADLLGGVPAPVGGALYRALDAYLHQVVGLPYPGVTQQLAALWIVAALRTPMATDAPTPPPIVVSAKTSLVVRAVKPTIIQRGGTWSGFTAPASGWIGAPDDTDGTNEALNLDPVAAIGGILYGRLLGYLTSAPTATPAGLGQPLAQSQSDLAAAWALAPTLAS